jgi:hypothetical protein
MLFRPDISRQKAIWAVFGVFAVALALNLAFGLLHGMNRPMESDAAYFRDIARSLAAGTGYRLPGGFWPDQPTMTRAPAWPFTVSLGLRAMGHISPDTAMRAVALLVNAFVAPLVAVLALMLFRRLSVTVLSGLCYAAHPSALFFASTGLSEPLFVLLAVAGTILALAGNRQVPWAIAMTDSVSVAAMKPSMRRMLHILGWLLLGAASLARVSFVVWPVVVAVLSLSRIRRNAMPLTTRMAAWAVLLGAAFAAAPLAWTVRNAAVCGRFPVLSTIRGQTFYGGNNPVVASDFKYWGYWVFPDAVPGETPMSRLAARMSEIQVDEYYMQRSVEFLRANPEKMPWMILGKLVRAYVPVPWKWDPRTAVASAFRWILYIAAAWGAWRVGKDMDPAFRTMLGAMFTVNIATVALFWGHARFAFELEPFLIPLAMAGMLEFRRRHDAMKFRRVDGWMRREGA